MATKRKISEDRTIYLYNLALTNAINDEDVYRALKKIGCDDNYLNTGIELFKELEKKHRLNYSENSDETMAYSHFSDLREALDDLYSKHRKMTKVVFRNQPNSLKKLDIHERKPRVFGKWIYNVSSFYKRLSENKKLRDSMYPLRISDEELSKAMDLVKAVDNSRSVYLLEKGEAQNATREKDEAFARIDDWMSEFFAIARIALEDSPQKLESLGIVVK